MEKRKKVKIIAGAALALLFVAFAAYTISKGRKKEAALNMKTLPEFAFKTMEDAPYTQRDVPEDKSVIIFHFSPDCDHCQNEATDLKEKMEWFKDVHILMVADKPKNEIEAFAQNYGLEKFPQVVFLQEQNGAFFNAFGTAAVPLAYIYDSEHRLLKNYNGETKMEAIKSVFDQQVREQ